VPVAVWLILSDRLDLAFWLFVAAAISDAVDGFLAKRFHAETEVGRFLDPLADKALLVCVYVTLGRADYLPLWLVIVVVSRDVLIIGGAILDQLLSSSPLPIRPLVISKVNTFAQILLAMVVLVGAGLGVETFGAGPVLVWIVAVTTVVSGVGYLIGWWRHVASIEMP
jgi:cardiolipin synthase (CMP-forming)